MVIYHDTIAQNEYVHFTIGEQHYLVRLVKNDIVTIEAVSRDAWSESLIKNFNKEMGNT